MGVVLLRSVILYLIVIFALRLMGKRQLGELQPGELVITILISNIATLPIENPALPLLPGILPILILVCLEVIMSFLAMKFKKLRKLVSGSPKIVIRDGIILQDTMLELRLTIDDLLMALRNNQIFSPEEVQFAIVETTGAISVYPKAAYRNIVQEDIGIYNKSENPPCVIVSDGAVMDKALDSIGKDVAWLNSELKRRQLTVERTFLLMADENEICIAIEKEGKHKS